MLILFSSCNYEIIKNFSVLSGSKADGRIVLFFDHNSWKKPIPQYEQGLALAKQKCQLWGYSGAEWFGSATQDCLQQHTSTDPVVRQVFKNGKMEKHVTGYETTTSCIAVRVKAEAQCTH